MLSDIYDSKFNDNSFGFRPNRSAHDAIMRTLDYLNEGYEWVIDLDIEAYFDTVNHDKLISILREHVNDSTTLHLIRKCVSMPSAGTLPPSLALPARSPAPSSLALFCSDYFKEKSRLLGFVWDGILYI